MHFIKCPVCEELHHFKTAHNVLAFVCPFLEGAIHLPFYSVKDIEAHKKECEPKGQNNIFKRKEANDDG